MCLIVYIHICKTLLLLRYRSSDLIEYIYIQSRILNVSRELRRAVATHMRPSRAHTAAHIR